MQCTILCVACKTHKLIYNSSHPQISSKMMFHFSTPRQARVFTLGEPGPDISELWLVFHGYGQLAEYFIKHFEPLADGSRWIVAPEGLSRFYLQLGGDRVGASWMTKVDRLTEIEDQINYLDSLSAYLRKQLPDTGYKVHVLGFSQGVATAWRWLTQGKSDADSLILWAGKSPREYPEQGMQKLQGMKTFSAVGTKDPFVTPERMKDEFDTLTDKFPDIQTFTFEGKHEMHAQTLLKIADKLRE